MLILPDEFVIRLDLAPSCVAVCLDTNHLMFERSVVTPNFVVGLWRVLPNGQLDPVLPVPVSDRLQEVHGIPCSVFPVIWSGDPPVHSTSVKTGFLGYHWRREGLVGYVEPFRIALTRDCDSDGVLTWSLDYRGRYTLSHFDPSANPMDELGVGEVLSS